MTKRIVQIEKEIYNCDCCGVEFEGSFEVMGTQYGFIDGEYTVVFEPKVFGDYCKHCTELIQDNWNFFGREGICHDRYDSVSDFLLNKEIEEVKEYLREYNSFKR